MAAYLTSIILGLYILEAEALKAERMEQAEMVVTVPMATLEQGVCKAVLAGPEVTEVSFHIQEL